MTKNNSYQAPTLARATFSISAFRRSQYIFAASVIVAVSALSQLLVPVSQNVSAAASVGGKWDALSTSVGFNCSLFNGEVYCWGANDYGQLGNGTTDPTSTPTPTKVVQDPGFLAGKTVTAISAGEDHTCAIADSEAYCWGANDNGQLGDGTNDNALVPTKVTQAPGVLAGKTVTAISTSFAYTCALADGEAYCWGYNGTGILGDGTNDDSTVPTKVVQDPGFLAGKTVTAISAGEDHTCAIADSEAYCWGANDNGQLGDGTNDDSTVPTKVVQDPGFLAGKTISVLAASYGYSCAIADDEAYCWGNNGDGQLGDGTTDSTNVPTKVMQDSGFLAGKTVTAIATAYSHTCAIADGEAYCWGANDNGQLGDGTNDPSMTPTKVSREAGVLAGESIVSIAVGGDDHTCVVANGTVYCWGFNQDGSTIYESGDGDDNSTVPIVLAYILPSVQTADGSLTGTPTLPSRPTFTGYAQPNSTVVVTVHSDPVSCSATANTSGYWTCTLPTDLPNGVHTVMVVFNNPNGEATELGPYSVHVLGTTSITGSVGAPNTGYALTSGPSVYESVIISVGVGLLTFAIAVRKRHTTYRISSTRVQ